MEDDRFEEILSISNSAFNFDSTFSNLECLLMNVNNLNLDEDEYQEFREYVKNKILEELQYGIK